MSRIIWKLLMFLWTRQAKKAYGGPGKQGELFNTACFQNAVAGTTGHSVSSSVADDWLRERGYFDLHSHWFAHPPPKVDTVYVIRSGEGYLLDPVSGQMLCVPGEPNEAALAAKRFTKRREAADVVRAMRDNGLEAEIAVLTIGRMT